MYYRATGGAHYRLPRVVLGEAEVDEFDAGRVALALQHKVLWLDVSINEILLTFTIIYLWLI